MPVDPLEPRSVPRLGAGRVAPERLTNERELTFWRLRTQRARGAHRVVVHGPRGSGRATFIDALVAAEGPEYSHVVTARCATVAELELTIRHQLAEQGVDCHPDAARTVRRMLGQRKELLLAIVDPPSADHIRRCVPHEVNGLAVLGTLDDAWPNDATVELGPVTGNELYSVFESVRRHSLHRSHIPDRPLLPRTVVLASELGTADDPFPIDDLLDPDAECPVDEQLALTVKKPVARLQTRARQLLAVLVLFGPGYVPSHLLGVGLGLGTGAEVGPTLAELNGQLVAAGLTHERTDGALIDPATWHALVDNTLTAPPRKTVQRVREECAAMLRSADELTLESLMAIARFVEQSARRAPSSDLALLTALAPALADRGALRGAAETLGLALDQIGDAAKLADDKVDILNDRGLFRLEMSEVVAALDDFEGALSLLDAADEFASNRRALVLANVGRAEAQLERYAAAVVALEQSSALLRATPQDTAFHEAMVLLLLAECAVRMDDIHRAQTALRHGQQSASAISDADQRAGVRRIEERVVELIGQGSDAPDRFHAGA